nr:immunoglobulin heavy chain junction region [Mus musculus]
CARGAPYDGYYGWFAYW